jgi:hypothetical protein
MAVEQCRWPLGLKFGADEGVRAPRGSRARLLDRRGGRGWLIFIQLLHLLKRLTRLLELRELSQRLLLRGRETVLRERGDPGRELLGLLVGERGGYACETLLQIRGGAAEQLRVFIGLELSVAGGAERGFQFPVGLGLSIAHELAKFVLIRLHVLTDRGGCDVDGRGLTLEQQILELGELGRRQIQGFEQARVTRIDLFAEFRVERPQRLGIVQERQELELRGRGLGGRGRSRGNLRGFSSVGLGRITQSFGGNDAGFQIPRSFFRIPKSLLQRGPIIRIERGGAETHQLLLLLPSQSAEPKCCQHREKGENYER